MNTTFDYPLTILEGHLDTFGHVNNAVYLELLEEARWDIITRRGYGLETIKQTGMGPTLLEVQLRFMRELRLRQKIVIHSQMISYEGKVSVMRQWMVNEAGETCCDASLKIALFDVRLRKLVAPTPEWLDAVGVKN